FNNAVRYTSPTYNGLTGSVMMGFGEQAGDSKKGRNVSAGLNYANGPLKLVFAYSRLNDRAAGYAGTYLGALGLGSATSIFNRLTTYAAGAGYVVGSWRLNAIYTQTKADLPAVSFKQKNVDLGAAWKYGEKSTLNMGY